MLIVNLTHHEFMGVVSEGMLLGAFNDDATKVELLRPPSNAKAGDRVMCK